MNSPCTKLKNAHFGIKTQKMEKAWRKWKQDKKTTSLSQGCPWLRQASKKKRLNVLKV